ncbi:MAG: hypothetical protein KDC68_01600, partial [Gelidibacter sp.]|nr:hypothetical protein [Gelidibacter sp.]
NTYKIYYFSDSLRAILALLILFTSTFTYHFFGKYPTFLSNYRTNTEENPNKPEVLLQKTTI